MNLPFVITRKSRLSSLEGNIEALNISLQSQRDEMDKQEQFDNSLVATIQAAADVMTVNTSDDDSDSSYHYTGNPYPTYISKVKALTRMYEGLKKWGNDTAKNVVDIRAAFIVGNGVKVIKDEKFTGSAGREIKFIQAFMDFNRLDEDSPQEWGRTAEIEGKFLVTLETAKSEIHGDTIKAIRKPWHAFPYTVFTPDYDFDQYVFAKYQGSSEKTSFNLTEERFVYRRFAGTPQKPNETPSKVAMVLRNIQDLDKSYWDWRKINHLYASPTPTFTFEETETAEKFLKSVQYKNWRIGKGIVIAKGTFDLICYKGEGYTTLKDEAKYHARKISGATGVPVHFFGYPDLLSNRDIADNTIEGIILSTTDERETWISFYEELFQKAIIMFNKTFSNDLDPKAITAVMPATSSSKMKEVEEVWLPAFEKNAISLETFLSKLPDMDVSQEVERIRNAPVSKSSDSGNGGGKDNRDGGSSRTRQNKAI